MPNSVKKEEVEQVVETVTPVVEEVVPVEVKLSPSFNKEEIVAKLAELASIFRTMYGEQLNPVFAEIHKSLSNAQYKIMQNL
jgi:dihydroorotate dehydrogenase